MAQASTLRLQFPVSSGSQHHAKENEWVPVEKPSVPAAPAVPAPAPAPSPAATTDGSTGSAAQPENVSEEQKVFPNLANVVSKHWNLVPKGRFKPS